MRAAKKLQVIEGSNSMSREKWAVRINQAWRDQVPSIFETGNLLEASKEQMKHGEWGAMCKSDLPFNRKTADKLIAIAKCENLRNDSHGSHLPAVWTTLYELTLLKDEQFAAGIVSGVINPRMQRKDVNALRGLEPKPKPAAKKKDETTQTVSEWIGEFSLRMHSAKLALNAEEKERLRNAIIRLAEDLK